MPWRGIIKFVLIAVSPLFSRVLRQSQSRGILLREGAVGWLPEPLWHLAQRDAMKLKQVCLLVGLLTLVVNPLEARERYFSLGASVTGLLQFTSENTGKPTQSNGVGIFGEFDTNFGLGYEWVEAKLGDTTLTLDLFNLFYEFEFASYSLLLGWGGLGSAKVDCATCSSLYETGSVSEWKMALGYSYGQMSVLYGLHKVTGQIPGRAQSLDSGITTMPDFYFQGFFNSLGLIFRF